MGISKVKVHRKAPPAGPRMMRWPLPKGCSIASVVVRELAGDDDIEATINADKFGSSAAKDTIQGFATVAQRERVLLSIVEYVDLDGRRHAVDATEPFRPKWTMRTFRFIERAWMKLNAIDQDELDFFERGGVPVAANEVALPADDEDELEEDDEEADIDQP